jgi:hypothetical protein
MLYDSAINIKTMGQLAEEKELANLLQTGGRKGFAAMEYDASVNMSQYMGGEGLTESMNGNTRMVAQRFGPGAMNDADKMNSIQPAGPEASYDSGEGMWVCIGPGEPGMKFASATKVGAESALAAWTAQGAQSNPMDGDEDKQGMELKTAPEAKKVMASNVMKGVGFSESERIDEAFGSMGSVDKAKAVGASLAIIWVAMAAALSVWAIRQDAANRKIIEGLSRAELKTYFDNWRVDKELDDVSIGRLSHEAESLGEYIVRHEKDKMRNKKESSLAEAARDPYVASLLQEAPWKSSGGFQSLAATAAKGFQHSEINSTPRSFKGTTTPLSGGVPGALLPTFAKLIAGGIGLAAITAAYHKLKGVAGAEPTDAELEVEVRKGK